LQNRKGNAQAQIFSRKHGYFLKCDIRKYFESIDHAILKEMLARKFKDADLIWLLNVIIDSAGSKEAGKGIPIGSLTSQHFANLYLDRFDHYIKDFMRIKGYLRYMDDFILFGDEKAELHLLHSGIRNFLNDELNLGLKDKATVIGMKTKKEL
jgi:RNA-directed DNA polymerase